MSTGTIRTETNPNQQTVDYDYRKIFLQNNKFYTGTVTASGADVTIVAGEVVARDPVSGDIVTLAVGATDGTEIPIGICKETITVLDGNTGKITFGVSGKVDENFVSVSGAGTLESIIANRRLRDRIAGDTLGIDLDLSVENTTFDN